MAKKDKELKDQLSYQAKHYKSETQSLQHKLSQRGFELIKQQHEVASLKQQLDEALSRAKRAEESSAAIW
jgi:hypothetical protein